MLKVTSRNKDWLLLHLSNNKQVQNKRFDISFNNCASTQLILKRKNPNYRKEEQSTFNWKKLSFDKREVWLHNMDWSQKPVSIDQLSYIENNEVFYYPFIQFTMNNSGQFARYYPTPEQAIEDYKFIVETPSWVIGFIEINSHNFSIDSPSPTIKEQVELLNSYLAGGDE